MTRRRKGWAVLAATLVATACGAPDEPSESLEGRYGVVGEISTTEPVDYTTDPIDFTGPTPIQSIYDMIPADEFVWYGTSPESDYRAADACDNFATPVETVDTLPAEIEGIVTLHPRYFQKTSWCGSDERYYGSYLIQDETGGFLVLKDSRVADFTFGDRVKIKVHGLLKFFDTYAISVHTDEQIISTGNPVFYEDIGDRDLTSDDIGKNLRIRREVASVPTNANFNEMCLVPEGEDYIACDPRCVANEQCTGYVLASLDRELGTRNPRPLEEGQVIEMTGPVVNSFGLRLLVSRIGQITFIEE